MTPLNEAPIGTAAHTRTVIEAKKSAWLKTVNAEKQSPECEPYFSEAAATVMEALGKALSRELVSALDLAGMKPDPDQTLLGDRWLCRGGAALMIAPSGVGKSSASMQMDVCWAAGREAFGIMPAKPLRILTIQAENDQGDMHEMVTGVMRGMGFSKDEEGMIRENCFFFFEQSRTGEEFAKEVVEPLLASGKFDLLRIDPLSAYAGADMTQADKSAAFLRNQLNPLLAKYGCGLILVHHTPKANNRDTSKWRASDWMYAGAGSADIVNWARAALVIDPCGTPGLHRFIAAKRGRRIGWEEGEQRVEVKWYKWVNGSVFWEPAEPEEPMNKAKRTASDLYMRVPHAPEMISKEVLINQANDYGSGNGIGIKAAQGLLKELIDKEQVRVIEVPRSGTNPAKFLQRISTDQTLVTSSSPPVTLKV